MKSYQCKNKYNKTIYFEFNETEMTIKKEIGNQFVEYNFKYQDIEEYNISYIPNGFYRIFFKSNNKIKETRDGKITYNYYLNIVVKNNAEITLDHYFSFQKETETNIRKVIRDNTPLRSSLDKLDDLKEKITSKYNEATSDTMGIIYITGPRKEWDTYTIKINDIPYIKIYTTKQYKKLEENGIKIESKAKPHWIDNKTIAFKIPFGEWNIAYTYTLTYGPSGRDHAVTSTKKIHVIINSEHKIVKLKRKSTLFSTKLIEI